jgi:hypothetical protein
MSGPGRRPTEGLILLADGSSRQHILLHELAHLLAPADAGHGPEFVGVHLDLVRSAMGFFAYAAYRAAIEARPELSGIATAHRPSRVSMR